MKKVISTTNAPAAIGPYSQAIEVNGMLFISGQIPIDPATGEIVAGGITEQTTQSFKNIRAILTEAGYSFDNVVKTTVFLSDMADFAAMNAVYAQQFSGDFPARSAVAVKTLPKNVLVEVETIAAKLRMCSKASFATPTLSLPLQYAKAATSSSNPRTCKSPVRLRFVAPAT